MANQPHTQVAADRQSWRIGNQNGLKHGAAVGRKTTGEYNAWKGMRQRCGTPTHRRYPEYGGRGIRVCERWRDSFATFLADMGPKPSPAHSLDRIDVNGHYEPSNCRWTTQKEQCRNQRRNRMVVYKGKEMTLAELAETVEIDRSHIRYHLNQGRSAEAAVRIIRVNKAVER